MRLLKGSQNLNKAATAIGIAALLSFAPPLAMAETFYKWKNESGSWTYGAHPPPGVDATAVQTTTGRSKPVQPAEPSAEQAEGADNEGNSVPEGAEYFVSEKPKVPKKERERLCKAAKSNLETLNSAAVIRRRDPDGSVTVVSDEERQGEIETARQAIKDYC